MQTLPREILERSERVLEYHRATKHTYDSIREDPPVLALSNMPAVVRSFPGLPKVALPTGLLDLPVSALRLMSDGLAALPDSHVAPPQDLKTLATWLFMAYGVVGEKRYGLRKVRFRTCPSASALYPCEIYVAAFAIQGLEPGLYHFNPHEFTLTKLRGPETLHHIKRGRPDLEFLKSVPAALLVSTIFWRSAWKYRARSYRVAATDAGHLVANIVTTANGLGVQTLTRLKMNDNTMRELIGLPPEQEFGSAEAVHAMVVWADGATCPMALSERTASGPLGPLPPIPRAPLSPQPVPYGSVLAVHHDCVAPGNPIREIRPPITESSPFPPEYPLSEMPMTEEPCGLSVRQALLKRRSARQFLPAGVSRNRFLAMNRIAFRTGSFTPLFPEGPHIALVRPFWIISDVTGMNAGIWYYHPVSDKWVCLRRGNQRNDAAYLCLEQPMCGIASAVCFMAVNLPPLMNAAGPDVYRLAHLEAGIAGQRMALAAASCGLACCGVTTFYDDDTRAFFGLQNTGWEILYATAVGVMGPDLDPPQHPSLGIA